nr:UvrD-like helicase, ATP-binding domain, P-loop containing nucleoside triphosphate hydrolase [Tanacetum cinerariifolium]
MNEEHSRSHLNSSSETKISLATFKGETRDLWKVCNDYGTVVDVFIPNKKSKAGKRFAFVRFIKESDSDVVSDTYFGDNGEDQGLKHQHGESSNAREEVKTMDTITSIPYPLGFTPVNEIPVSIKQHAPEVESDRPPNRSERSNSRVLKEVANYVDKSSSESINNGIKLKEGGSILEILEEMITVGQTIGFSM